MGTPQLGQSLECLDIHLSEVGSRSPATRCATSICCWSSQPNSGGVNSANERHREGTEGARLKLYTDVIKTRRSRLE